jgi:transcriptional regulator with XRE-family HTH domain
MLPMGRPITKKRPPHGAHLTKLRLAAGITQAQLAEAIGERQQAVAYWETAAHPPRSDVLPKLAKALGVTVEQLLQLRETRHRPGPVGKGERLLDEIGQLPKGQQDRIYEVIGAMLQQFRAS